MRFRTPFGLIVLAACLVSADVGARHQSHRGRQRIAEPAPVAPWEGMPVTLPADYADRPDVLPFDPSMNGGRAPIAAQLLVNGQRPSSTIFHETLKVRIPQGTKIQSQHRSGVDVWTYPVGTESIHDIQFDSVPPIPFELRIVRNRGDGTWAFGAYRMENGQWVLNTYSGLRSDRFEVQLRNSDRPDQIELKRINLQSCRNCHFMNAVKEQFATRESVGPCGFVSWNETLLEGWAKLFQERLGYFPVEQKPSPN